MVIGFLGKGGSGKSTLAATLARQLGERGYGVLAVDADHNLDLGFLLGHEPSAPYLSDGLGAVRDACGLPAGAPFAAAFTDGAGVRFSLSPADPFTARYAPEVAPGLRLMAAGPQTDSVRHGKDCSHALAAALKVYLPLLELGENEAAVVDEKASVDAVTTGIPTGFDLAVVCVEAKPQSVRAGEAIAAALDGYGVPWVVALNRARPGERAELGSLPEPFVSVPEGGGADLTPLIAEARLRSEPNAARFARTSAKFARAAAFAAP